MDMTVFELAILEYLDKHAEVITSDNLTYIGAELRDVVDMTCSEWALDNGLEYEGG